VEASLKDVLDSVIIRFGGELWTKKTWTRRLYERRLVRNIKNVLKRYEVPYSEIVRRHGRLFLRTNSAVEAARRLARIFGISSVLGGGGGTQAGTNFWYFFRFSVAGNLFQA